MPTRRLFSRPVFLACGLWLALVVVSGLWVWHARRQYALDRQLIAAINHTDTGKASTLLQRGADPK